MFGLRSEKLDSAQLELLQASRWGGDAPTFTG